MFFDRKENLPLSNFVPTQPHFFLMKKVLCSGKKTMVWNSRKIITDTKKRKPFYVCAEDFYEKEPHRNIV